MTTTSIKKRIEAFCKAHGIAIPGGFGRNTPSRYAIVRRDSGEPKLVAKTWLKQEDVCYYIQNTLIPELGPDFARSTDILDFKEDLRLKYSGSTRLQSDGKFTTSEEASAREGADRIEHQS